jgi:hypothetical protein
MAWNSTKTRSTRVTGTVEKKGYTAGSVRPAEVVFPAGADGPGAATPAPATAPEQPAANSAPRDTAAN